MKKILIVDDHAPLLSGLSRYIGIYYPDSEIETAASGRECLEKLQSNEIDVLILDSHLPDSSGYELCREILSIKHDMKIIVLTGTLDINDVKNMMFAGAYGYIVKTSITEEIIEGIESVLRGERFISACVREYPQPPKWGANPR